MKYLARHPLVVAGLSKDGHVLIQPGQPVPNFLEWHQDVQAAHIKLGRVELVEDDAEADDSDLQVLPPTVGIAPTAELKAPPPVHASTAAAKPRAVQDEPEALPPLKPDMILPDLPKGRPGKSRKDA